MSNESAWLLMRADARGLSGILTASTPTDFKNRAPSTSLRMSVPLGGTISTMVTNSLRASFEPKADRFSIGTAGVAFGAGPPVTCAGLFFPRASPARKADFMTRMWSGVVPQHPPTTRTPAAANLRA